MGTLRAEFEVRWSNLQKPLLAGVQKQSEDEEVDPQKHVASLISSAGLLSLATFSWINPLLALGYRKHLTIQDVLLLPPGDQGRALYKTFDGVWRRLKHDHPERTPSIALALIKTFWVSVLSVFTVNVVASFVGPYLIDDFVEFLHGRRRFHMEGYVLVSFFIIANVVANFTNSYYTLAMYQLNNRVRTCITAIIYRKVSST